MSIFGFFAKRTPTEKMCDRGFKLFRAGKMDEAIEIFREAYKSDPNCLEAALRLGCSLYLAGVIGQISADALLQLSVDLGSQINAASPDELLRRTERKVISEHRAKQVEKGIERLDEGIGILRETVERFSQNPRPAFLLGIILWNEGDEQGVLDASKALSERITNGDTFKDRRGFASKYLGQFGEEWLVKSPMLTFCMGEF